MKYEYHGVVIEEALNDNRLINTLKIEKVHITGHKKQQDRRHLYQVNISKEQLKPKTKMAYSVPHLPFL